VAAVESKDVAFIVLLAAPALPGEQILYLQNELIDRAAGKSEAEIVEHQSDLRQVFAIVKSEKDQAIATKKLRAIYDALPVAERKELERQPGWLDAELKQALSPWLRVFLMLDPRIYLKQVKVPVLALNGARDLQVPSGANQSELRKALKENQEATIRELPGLNHLFQSCQTCTLDEYGKLAETISPAVLAMVSDWIARHGKRGRQDAAKNSSVDIR
jgi:fermentation-respiration switch protein FrsA (DUF1100 family)